MARDAVLVFYLSPVNRYLTAATDRELLKQIEKCLQKHSYIFNVASMAHLKKPEEIKDIIKSGETVF